ncbi:MAG: hypothetical protein AAF518_20580 [Spirochaetota bacterium]
MKFLDYEPVIRRAWSQYPDERVVLGIKDISAMVSTNQVYRVDLSDGNFVIAKLSYFGTYEQFVEDHNIIHSMSRLLEKPFENYLATSLLKDATVYTYREQDRYNDTWVVFYSPVAVKTYFPKKLNEEMIVVFAEQIAHFHLACKNIKTLLPPSHKTLLLDVQNLLQKTKTQAGQFEYGDSIASIASHCELFIENYEKYRFSELQQIPLFVDWNIGNFSLDEEMRFFSRWDYDWFRIAPRVLDFYFCSRVVSQGGDQTAFSYYFQPLLEDRFLLFLQKYHATNPLSEREIYFTKEAYRFFILHYVINFGKHFFHDFYALRLQQEALATHLPRLDAEFQIERLLAVLR